MGPSKHRFLSREEEAELSRSKKKVKDVHHAEFHTEVKGGLDEGSQAQRCQSRWGAPKTSFRDRKSVV